MADRLGVSIVIPTLNAAQMLPRCLASIREQRFPQERVEVLVMDGGSTDDTRAIAERFDCRVLDNPARLAEPGVKLGLDAASHEIAVVMASDNDFPTLDCLDRVVRVFESSDVRGVYTHVVAAPDDGAFCRYFNMLHADPFNWFVYRPWTHPAQFGRTRRVVAAGPDHVVYDLATRDRPLLAFAQGFALRGELPRAGNEQDDMLPLWQLVDGGEQLAYSDVGIHHHTVAGFRDFLGKYHRRALHAMRAPDAAHRQRHGLLSRRQRIRRYLWVPYSVSVVLPLADALRGLVRDRDVVWLYHPLACLALTGALVRAALQAHRGAA
jgi:glycosyltransferase involved in cell wall biosynthesis